MGIIVCAPGMPKCAKATVNISTPYDTYWYKIYIDGALFGVRQMISEI